MKGTSFSTLQEVEIAVAEVLQAREKFVRAVARGEMSAALVGEFILNQHHQNMYDLDMNFLNSI